MDMIYFVYVLVKFMHQNVAQYMDYDRAILFLSALK